MKLPRIQLHLSTCVVLMFVAGALVWANVSPRNIEVFLRIGVDLVGAARGWPTIFKAEHSFTDIEPWPWNWTHLFIDISVALAILAAVAFACEWIIRRRERTKNQELRAKS